MKTYKWKITAFVVWVVITLIVVSVALRDVSKADTATNLISVAILLFWTLLSFATNCFTFKKKKIIKKKKTMSKIKSMCMFVLPMTALCLTSCSIR
jgi:hypothetical protein